MGGTLKAEQYYTYEEWLDLDNSERTELVDGALYMLAEPTSHHQSVLMELGRQLANFLLGKPCRVYPAPFGVRLHKNNDTVFQPDISVICDPAKITRRGCIGAPDVIIEILSSSTSRYDRFTKFYEYQRAGVREYWIADPDDKIVTVHIFNDGACDTKVYSDSDAAPVQILPGCEIDWSLAFKD
jgi:Uma2 family endonuclease